MQFTHRLGLTVMLVGVGLVWSGCGPKAEQAEPLEPVSEIAPPPQARPDYHTSRDSLDWDGTYTGGGRSLTLNRDGSFTLEVTGVEPLMGDFEWSGDGSSITLMGVGEVAPRFLVGEGVLVEIDAEGQPVEGDNPAAGRLKKVEGKGAGELALKEGKKLGGRQWILVELRGRPVELAGGEGKEIFLEFDEAEGRVSGFGGCNRFSGPYELKDGFRLSFGNLMSTLMACPDLDTEQEFFGVLREVDNFTMSDDGSTLSLNKARMAPLARFKAK